ncbi:MAG: glycosyltransferase family 9 protein [Hungatella sp.]|nr:glycosyltransferase family 9 protein [Hungatella sp.]
MIKKFNIEKTRQLKRINKILSLFYRKSNYTAEIKFREARNILIVDFALMGDMIMDIPFLKTIRHNCPKAHITMVAMQWAEIILGDQKLVDEFIIFDGKNILSSPKSILKNRKIIRKILDKINLKTYEIGFEPKGDFRHIWFMHNTKSMRTVSYNYTGGEYLITDSFVPKESTKHLIDEKLDLLEMCGMRIYNEDCVPQLLLSKSSKIFVEKYLDENDLNGKRIIGIHPGASNNNKQYKGYPELVKKMGRFLKENDMFCVFEGPEESKIVDAVCDEIKLSRRPYVRVKVKTKEYVILVYICDYMICNDSAAGHIAAAYGIPVTIIFGPVSSDVALPRGRGKINYISHNLSCKPCTLPECPEKTEKCISEIGAEEVLEKILELMEV